MKSEEKIWPKKITVNKRIVGILSTSTYENFPNALKEIITNSYDADARRVNIEINIKNEEIIIEDDGKGMDEADFTRFLNIAGEKKVSKYSAATKRQHIGMFGVGFLSVFPFFKNYYIESKKENSNQLMYASIPCYLYFDPDDAVDLESIKIDGGTRTVSDKDKLGFTRIKLSGFSELTENYFYPDQEFKAKRNSIGVKSPMEKLKWGLGEDLPIEYEEDLFNKLVTKYSPIKKFDVIINGEKLKRKTYGSSVLEVNGNTREFKSSRYSKNAPQITDDTITEGEKNQILEYQYFIVAEKFRGGVQPNEARGIKIRNLNVGVGERTYFGLGTEIGGARSRLHWLTGELHIVSGGNSFIKVSRDDFHYSETLKKIENTIIERLLYHANKLEEEAEYISRKESASKGIIKNLDYVEEIPNEDKLEVTRNSIQEFEEEEFILFEENVVQDEVRISVSGREYKVLTDSWAINDNLFRACKYIDDSTILLNRNYALFETTKYTDVFIRMHVMILDMLIVSKISEIQYDSFMENIEKTFKDYF